MRWFSVTFLSLICALLLGLGISSRAQTPATGPSTQPLAAEPAATQPSADVIQATAAALSDDSFAVREAAQDKLVEQGEAARPLLEALLREKISDEARHRVQAALRSIDDNSAMAGSIITLNMESAPTADILAEFARQCHADLGLDRPDVKLAIAGHTATVHIDHKDFWEALRVIDDACGVGPSLGQNMPHMTLTANGRGDRSAWLKGPGVTSGCFRLSAESCQITRVTDFQGMDRTSNFLLALIAVAEPKMRICGIASGNGDNPAASWIQECVDENGNSLLKTNGPAGGFAGGADAWNCQLMVNLQDAPHMGKRIAKLKGTLRYTMEIRSQVIEIDNILAAKNLVRRVGDSVLTVQDVTRQNNQVQVRVELAGGGNLKRGMEGAMFRQLIHFGSTAQLLGKDGSRFILQGTNASSDGKHRTLELVYVAAPGPASDPQKLVWDVPMELRDVVVPFELKDLPLP